METRRKGKWLAAFCAVLCLLTAFAAGAWAGDAADFVSKTYPDNTTIAGGTSFTQTWTIRNSGTTTWTSSYKLRWMSGSLGSSRIDIPVSGTVAPGGTYSFSMTMRAPAAQSSAVTYKEEWKFINGSGTILTPLGTLWAQIVVPAASDDHGNNISTATAVSINTGRSGVINYGGDYDYFRIVVPSSGTLTVYTTGSTDTYGYLKNSSGTDLASNDDQLNGDINFRIARAVTAGTYYVAVRNYYSTGTGSYTFYAGFTAAQTDDHGNSISAATTVNINSSTAGTINYAGDYDYFRVSVPSSGTLTVYTTGSTDTYGILKNSSGTDIASNDDYNGNMNFRISASVTAGTYYIAVRHWSSTGTGSYAVRVDFSGNNTTVAQAMNNARNNLNRTAGYVAWDGVSQYGIWADSTYTYCARFARMCLGEFTARFADAISMYNYFNGLGLINRGTNPPEGAVVFYAAHTENGQYGHVGIANGAGQSYSVVSRTYGVQLRNVTGAFSAPYLGYVTADVFKAYH